ncbi:hypothetical protein BDV33DRAFT_193332 [Aspergillus novoparasiticus]|uniref:Uncharacterized protein n=1 Tax=Aspergillus novoparasiticus TaxID=986946 RepID=A0A5N6EN05_9EURO|nr:hypothetical protein BDV33DRAFT_193332 [Aspergillus novoparasiticus]
MSTTPTSPQPSVSVVGLGLMGSALARAFLTKGHKVAVWNRSAAKAVPMAADGASVTSTAAECIVASPLVITCITNSDAFRDTMESLPPSIGSDRILVDFTTGCPSQVNQSAEIATNLGFKAYIHGAVMAFPAQVGREESLLYYSGNRNAFINVELTLSALGTPVYLDDDPISAALQEVIMVSSMYSWWAGFLQSIALLRTTKQFNMGQGSVSDFFEETLAPLYAHSVEIFRTMCTEIDSGKYKTKGDGARLALHLASLRNYSKTFRDQGVSDEIMQPIVELVEQRIAQGGGDEELSALVEVLSGSGWRKGPF